MEKFNYSQAFSRNLGWLTSAEAELLRSKTVAIAGAGGVGGQYCEVLARLGVSRFHLADPDSFEQVNFNRQNGSGMSTVGRKKLEVIKERILDINPEAKITVFTKDSMPFEKYFGYKEEHSTTEKAMRFMLGATPTLVQRHYQADRSRVDFDAKKVPSTAAGVYLCAGVAGTMTIKILLARGPISKAPWSLHYDAYLRTYKKRYTWGGFANPLQKLKLIILRKIILGSRQS